MKRCVILNPSAGRGKAGRRRHELERALSEAGIAYDLVTTHARGGATELTYQAIERGYNQIIAVGGDGTLNEVVNGIVGSRKQLHKNASLSIVPLGTGSDFIKVLDGIRPNDLAGAVRRLARDHTRAVDVGRITVEAGTQKHTRYFINALSMGIDAQVAVESLKITKLKGFAVYLLAVIRALAIYKVHPMTVHFDDHEIQRRLLFTSVANGRCQGGGFWLTPQAQIDDGLFDLCMIDNMRLNEIIRHIPKLLNGSHTRLRQVMMGRAQHVTVTSSHPIPVATDGEVVVTDAQRITVEILPGAIEIII